MRTPALRLDAPRLLVLALCSVAVSLLSCQEEAAGPLPPPLPPEGELVASPEARAGMPAPAPAPESPLPSEAPGARVTGAPERPEAPPGAPAGPATAPPARPSYCDATAAIAAYPRFGRPVPEVVARLHPRGGRDYPVIDAHTHLATTASEEVQVQRQVGLHASVHAAWDAVSTAALRATYPRPNLVQFNLGSYLEGFDASRLTALLAALDAQEAAGADGIKLFKHFGLTYDDASGARLRIDDPRLSPVWERAAELEWTVSIHVADTDAWMARDFATSPYSKQELIEQFIRVVERHPRTVFVAIHLLNLMDSEAELEQLGRYLERYPNLYADTAARSQYLVKLDQGFVRDFVIAHQDKLLFATDRAQGEGAANYEAELRYWETDGATGTFYLNQKARGLGLPPGVLEKLYYRNALRAFCGPLVEAGER